jgi:hypothetical protein
MGSNDLPPVVSREAQAYRTITQHRAVLGGLVETARVATDARIVQITYFDRQQGLIESLAWAGFHIGLADAALKMAWRLFPNFDPYQVKPPVEHNRHSARVYVDGEAVRAPFDEVAFGAVDHRILAVAMAVGKIRESYLHPLRLGGEVFGAIGFHAQDITAAQLDGMQQLAWIAQGMLQLLSGERHRFQLPN